MIWCTWLTRALISAQGSTNLEGTGTQISVLFLAGARHRWVLRTIPRAVPRGEDIGRLATLESCLDVASDVSEPSPRANMISTGLKATAYVCCLYYFG